MFARAAAEAVEAGRLLSLCLDEDAPRGLLRFFEGMGEPSPAT